MCLCVSHTLVQIHRTEFVHVFSRAEQNSLQDFDQLLRHVMALAQDFSKLSKPFEYKPLFDGDIVTAALDLVRPEELKAIVSHSKARGELPRVN